MDAKKEKLISELVACEDLEYAEVRKSFFQTGTGQYSEKDKFLGINIADIRKFVMKNYRYFELADVAKIVASPYHELRMAAVLMLVKKYKNAKNETEKRKIFDFYVANIEYVNNWDLADFSAGNIVGNFLYSTGDFRFLKQLANSGELWQQRIAIVSTIYFIKQGKYDVTLELVKLFIKHPHHLIHKASGWMLREIGKKDETVLCNFLDIYKEELPRTALRYAIERLGKEQKMFYMKRSK